MMRRTRHGLGRCLVLMLLLPASSACDVHVDASARPGGDGSPGAPFATIAAAQFALRAARAAPAAAPHPAAPAPTRVCLASGVYRETLRFTAEDSGGAGASAPVIYEAAPGAANNVSISGALPLAFAPLAPDDPARALLPPGVAASVVVADLFAAGLTPAALAAAAQALRRWPTATKHVVGFRLCSGGVPLSRTLAQPGAPFHEIFARLRGFARCSAQRVRRAARRGWCGHTG